MMTRGEGPFLYDSAGKRYIDAISSWWCCNIGHTHPRIVDAIAAQAQQLQHSILGNLSHPRAIELAGRLTDLLPSQPRRAFFACDGASAVEAALKIAVLYHRQTGAPERQKFISLKEAYHGDTLGAVSVGYLDAFHSGLRPLIFPVHQIDRPCPGARNFGLCAHTCVDDCLRGVERLFDEIGARTAALIVEPLCQCAAGMRMYDPTALASLDRLCNQHGALLIVDEIATGFNRTGRRFAHEHAGIDPDIVCVGKALSAGTLPISATVVTERIAETFSDEGEDHTFYHGHTFAGNPIACAAALAALEVYEQEDIAARAAEGAEIMQRGIATLVDLRGVMDARCLGMIGAVEFEQPPAEMHAELLNAGYLLRPLANVLYLMPPLNTPHEVLQETVDAFVAAAARQATRV